MKTLIFLLCVLCAAAAWAQNAAVLNSQVQPIQIISHPEHASPQPMAQEQSILLRSNYIHAQGTRPLWELEAVSNPMPLGDAARILRKEHAAAKKADIIWEN